MEWQKTSIKIMNLSEEILAVITPIQWVLFAASLAFVILTFIKDKRLRWLAASFGVISFGLFVNMYIYCNSFDVLLSKIAMYRRFFPNATFEKVLYVKNFLVGFVLLLDFAFIFLYCMHFIRNYHVGIIHMIVAFLASVATRIFGYISMRVPPTFAYEMRFQLGQPHNLLISTCRP